MTDRRELPAAPASVRWVIRKLERAGFDTWAVGGIVRDALAGRPADADADDWDLATRARPEQVRAVFGRIVPVGVEHGTVGVLTREGMHEVTTYRRDVETFGRRATVEFADDIDEDLARRDFTINAIAWHPLRREMRDPFGGAADLAAGTLRTVGDARTRFAEDFLRILRALRFAGRFALVIDPDTWRALCDHRSHLADLSPERVREELTKILASPSPSRALSLYAAAGVLPVLHPELARCVGHPGEDPLDAWSAALLTADGVSRRYPLARLACLLGRIGAPSRGAGEELPPEERAGMRAAAVMERLRYSRANIEDVRALVRAAALRPEPGAGPARLRRWLRRTRRVDRRHLFRIWIARARLDAEQGIQGPKRAVLSRWSAVRRELATDPPLTVADLALSGRDLIEMGMRPGPDFGEVLAHLLDLVLDDPARNRHSILARRARRYLDARAQAPDAPARPA